MYMKVFPHGQGSGNGPTHYLVRLDYPNRDKHPPEVLRDRKSTCLNSSHRTISYAVFCLKKKTAIAT